MKTIDGYLMLPAADGSFTIPFGLNGEALDYSLPENGWTYCIDFKHKVATREDKNNA